MHTNTTATTSTSSSNNNNHPTGHATTTTTTTISATGATVRVHRDAPLRKLTTGLLRSYKTINEKYYAAKKERQAKATANTASSHNNGGTANSTGTSNPNSSNNQNERRDADYVVTVGDVLGGYYRVIESMGKGSFGQVVSAEDDRDKKKVAVKVIKNREAFRRQAKTEIRLLELLNRRDPEDQWCIVRFLESFEHNGHVCLVFEYLSFNLYELLRRTHFRGVSLTLIRKFARQILKTLAFLALPEIDIIHCDLKPENILFRVPNRSAIKVIDFGSSCYRDKQMYKYIQSRFYRSPEVILELPYDQAIDMWSLGCILVEMHTGMPLFSGRDEGDQMRRFVSLKGLPPRHMLQASKKTEKFFDITLPTSTLPVSITPVNALNGDDTNTTISTGNTNNNISINSSLNTSVSSITTTNNNTNNNNLSSTMLNDDNTINNSMIDNTPKDRTSRASHNSRRIGSSSTDMDVDNAVMNTTSGTTSTYNGRGSGAQNPRRGVTSINTSVNGDANDDTNGNSNNTHNMDSKESREDGDYNELDTLSDSDSNYSDDNNNDNESIDTNDDTTMDMVDYEGNNTTNTEISSKLLADGGSSMMEVTANERRRKHAASRGTPDGIHNNNTGSNSSTTSTTNPSSLTSSNNNNTNNNHRSSNTTSNSNNYIRRHMRRRTDDTPTPNGGSGRRSRNSTSRTNSSSHRHRSVQHHQLVINNVTGATIPISGPVPIPKPGPIYRVKLPAGSIMNDDGTITNTNPPSSSTKAEPPIYTDLRDVLGVYTNGPGGRRKHEKSGHSVQHYLQFLDLVERMLDYDPRTRIKPMEALNHPFLRTDIEEAAAAANSITSTNPTGSSSSSTIPSGNLTATSSTGAGAV